MPQQILNILLYVIISFQGLWASGQQPKEALQIPFYIQQDFIIVQVRLEGILPLKFIFDTGAENTILFDKLYADLLQTQYDLRIPIVGSNLQSVKFALVARNIDLEVADLSPKQMDILVLEEYDPRLKEYLGEEIHGIIGSSFFQNKAVEIDYRKQMIKIHPHNSLTRRDLRGFEYMDIEVRRGKPYLKSDISLRTNDSSSVLLLLDTGAGINVLIHTNTDSSLHLPSQTISGELGIGVSGVLTGYIGRLSEFAVGPYVFKSMITSFQDLDSGFLSQSDYYRNGIIGNTFLRRFHIIIDYPNERLYMSPERGYDDDFKYDRSGLTIIAAGSNLNEFFVQSVLPNSPADSAGIKPGDKLLNIQCWPSSFYSLGKVNKLFKKREGKKIRLKVKRNDEKLRFRFRLKKLI